MDCGFTDDTALFQAVGFRHLLSPKYQSLLIHENSFTLLEEVLQLQNCGLPVVRHDCDSLSRHSLDKDGEGLADGIEADLVG